MVLNQVKKGGGEKTITPNTPLQDNGNITLGTLESVAQPQRLAMTLIYGQPTKLLLSTALAVATTSMSLAIPHPHNIRRCRREYCDNELTLSTMNQRTLNYRQRNRIKWWAVVQNHTCTKFLCLSSVAISFRFDTCQTRTYDDIRNSNVM